MITEVIWLTSIIIIIHKIIIIANDKSKKFDHILGWALLLVMFSMDIIRVAL